ncbi:MAG: hypothetical protein J6A69_06300 [Clostridia bacterium]|nr:hypothetical protein [Clostridia bacterium]
MNIKLELLRESIMEGISNSIYTALKYAEIDVEPSVNSLAVKALSEIRGIIINQEISEDFDVVEKIIEVLEKYNIYAGDRHSHF